MSMQGLDSEIRAAYDRGEAEYGCVPIPFAVYATDVVRILARRNGSDAEALASALRAPNTTDLYLAIACEHKVEGAWEILSRRFFPGLKAMALRAGASHAEAEEIARALPGTLIEPPSHGETATRMAAYDASGSLFSWLATIANRQYLDRLRKDRAAPDVTVPPAPSPPDQIVGVETGDRVHEAMREALLDLSTREALLLVWKYSDSLSQAEMANRLQISEARVSQLMKRTVEKVRFAVLARVPDESARQWASRAQLWAALRNVVGKLLADR